MKRTQIVKRAFATLLVVTLLAGAGWEAHWRALYPATGGRAPSPGWLSVEQRFLGETALLPYGQGIFLFPTLAPARSVTAKLVFVGYCGNILLQWVSSDELHISCELAEGEPAVLVSEHLGVTITLSVVNRRGS